jgi:hypothetical protein
VGYSGRGVKLIPYNAEVKNVRAIRTHMTILQYNKFCALVREPIVSNERLALVGEVSENSC